MKDLDQKEFENVNAGFSWGGLVNGVKKVANVGKTGLHDAKNDGIF